MTSALSRTPIFRPNTSNGMCPRLGPSHIGRNFLLGHGPGYTGGSDPKFPKRVFKTNIPLFTRYRSTASFISLLLEFGLECPHRILDKYVEAFTDFRPTDGKYLTNREPPLPPNVEIKESVNKLKLEKMSE